MAEYYGEFPFDISARVPIQLGRESISSSTVAISELVKNSYDAGAAICSIDFSRIDDDLLIISDVEEGELAADGMSLSEVLEYWLKIGTEHKTESDESRGRVQTGAKGLGRLGADRLCRKLTLYTRKRSSDEVIKLVVEWQKYEDSDAKLSDIKHKVYKGIFSDEEFSHFYRKEDSFGTCLVMQGLKDEWRADAVSSLRGELSLLIPPFDKAFEFKICLRMPGEKAWLDVSTSNIVDAAAWYVVADIDKEGNVSCTAENRVKKKFHEFGSIKWGEWIKGAGTEPECGPLSFEFYYIPWSSDNQLRLDFKKGDWQNFMRQHNGVRIYRDLFRVRPYGEPSGKGDWLDLGLQKARSPQGIGQRESGWKVGPHQIIGAVFISRRENSGLQDQTNREGLMEGKAFYDLKRFAGKVIQYFELKAQEDAVADRREDELQRAKESVEIEEKKLREHIENAAKFSDGENEEIGALKKVFNEYREKARSYEKEIEKKSSELEREKNTLANLASLGILTVSFGHEVKEYAVNSNSDAIYIGRLIQKNKIRVDDDEKEEFESSVDHLIQGTDFIGSFSSFALSNVIPDKRQRRKVDVLPVCIRVFNALSKSLGRQNIKWDVSPSNQEFKIRAFEIDIESVFVNFITNSVWALRYTPSEERFIRVIFRSEGGSVFIIISDSGCGLEQGTEISIFNPMFSTKRDEKGALVGTGMGLAITRTFIEDHCGGRISANAKGDLGGADFTLEFPEAL